MKVVILVIFSSLIIRQVADGQIEHPVKWSFAEKKLHNGLVEVFIKATIEKGWHIYAVDQPDGGPVKTNLTIYPATDYKLISKIVQPAPFTEYEDVFKMNVRYFENSAVFHQKVMLTSKDAVVCGKVSYMACNHQKCLPPDEVEFHIPVK